jgi:superfamily I DNA/RNA helicase
MPPSAATVARQFSRNAADDGSGSDIPPGQFVDLAIFLLSVDAFRKLKGDGDAHIKKVTGLLNRYQNDFVDGAEKYLAPLIDDPAFARFKNLVHRGTRRMRGLEQAAAQAEMVTEMLRALHSRPTVLREVLSESRAVAAAVKVGGIVANDAPASVLSGLATVAPASRLQVTRKWVHEAADAAGVAPSEIERVIADVSAATSIGEDIHKVEARIAAADPVSEDAADLHSKKQALVGALESVVKGSASPAVVLAAATTAAAQSTEYATKTAKAQHLSPDQERAMMARGKAIIAAGAGSGKTKTLASKVAYHVNELGVPPGAIIATSFSRKSAAELRKRIADYGADIPTSAETGFGTTHSIAGKLMREYGGGGRDGLKNFEQSNLVRLAVEQVKMTGPGVPAPPEATSLFAGLGEAPAEPQAPAAPAGPGLTFRQACQLAFDRRAKLRNAYLQSFIESYFTPRDKWYGSTMRATRDLTDPRGLSDKQSDILRDIFDKLDVRYSLATDPNFMPKTPGRVAAKDKDKGLREKFTYFSRPAGQWFNLGLDLTEEGPNGEKKPIPIGVFKQAITKFKGRAVSPSEAWKLTGGSAEAAVYAAYEWLKGPTGEVDFQGRGDFDDILLDVSKMVLSSPRILRQVQSRFKVILVDEAQDLNRAQHLMFGLLSGFIDPAKVTNVAYVKKVGELAKDDGSMTADTYCFIGDDKQAIYEFRGADPEAFIDMSDLVEGGAGFKTEVLKTNYRSGELIVAAANRLIAHNTKQIPMTCNANPQRVDRGGIEIVKFAPVEGRDMKAPAEWLAAQIAEDVEEGRAGKKGYDAYGVGVRSNAEAYAYGLEMLKKGIPFRSKANFFNDPNTKALLHWLTIADEGLDGDVDRVNAAVLGARSAPATKLGPKFEENLTKMASGNYLVWLQGNWQQVFGSGGQWADLVWTYVRNLLHIASLKGTAAEEVLANVLTLEGFDGRTVKDVLLDKVREDEEALAELRAESTNGLVSEEAIAEVAFAPLAPLKGLLGARPDLTEAMKYTRQLQAANAKLSAVDDPEASRVNEPAVTIGTMHSWKGLEVENMFLPLVGGRFPRFDASEEDLASERRLAYVAVTRGENRVTVMNVPTARRTKQGVVVTESQFASELCIPSSSTLSGAVPGADLDGDDAEAEALAWEAGMKSASESPQDEEAMDAYLQSRE